MNDKIGTQEHVYLTITPAVNYDLSCNAARYSNNFPFSYL